MLSEERNFPGNLLILSQKWNNQLPQSAKITLFLRTNLRINDCEENKKENKFKVIYSK